MEKAVGAHFQGDTGSSISDSVEFEMSRNSSGTTGQAFGQCESAAFERGL